MSNRTTQTAADQQLADGLTTNAALIGTLTIAGKQVKPADVVQVLQTRITAGKAATAAKVNLKAAATTAKTTLAETRALIRAVRQALRLMFANDINLLATFGLAPAKQNAPKPAVKVGAAAKAKATRAARGTDKGKKQRKAIKAPVAPTPAPAPAPKA
jgi:hypothetical protein